jgi:hypothetical protein
MHVCVFSGEPHEGTLRGLVPGTDDALSAEGELATQIDVGPVRLMDT